MLLRVREALFKLDEATVLVSDGVMLGVLLPLALELKLADVVPVEFDDDPVAELPPPLEPKASEALTEAKTEALTEALTQDRS